jgi:hypothetical protein
MVDYVGRMCVIRSRDSGVWIGTVLSIKGAVVRLSNARRVWRWAGAMTLSDLATLGTTAPAECKWPAAVPDVSVRGWCEIVPCSGAALATYERVPVWTA